MKNHIGTVLIFLFLCANTEVHQFLKLPVLIHHFVSHHQNQDKESFADFLLEHYGNDAKHTKDNSKEHNNLPFKTADCPTFHVSMAFVSLPTYEINTPQEFEKEITSGFNHVFYSSDFHNNIWQPPKSC